MLSLPIAREKAGKKMAIELFKLVQIYMGDRKARPGMTLNSVASDIITMTLATAQYVYTLTFHLYAISLLFSFFQTS